MQAETTLLTNTDADTGGFQGVGVIEMNEFVGNCCKKVIYIKVFDGLYPGSLVVSLASLHND